MTFGIVLIKCLTSRRWRDSVSLVHQAAMFLSVLAMFRFVMATGALCLRDTPVLPSEKIPVPVLRILLDKSQFNSRDSGRYLFALYPLLAGHYLYAMASNAEGYSAGFISRF